MTRLHAYPAVVADWIRPHVSGREVVALPDEASFEAALPDIEVLACWRPPTGLWGRAARLRLIHSSGAGVDDILPAPDLPDDVQVANASGIHLPAMAEWIVAAILTAQKRFPELAESQRERRWKPRRHDVRPLAGSRVCVLGLGTIGMDVVRLLEPFGVTVVGTRRTPRPTPGVVTVHGADETLEAMSGADVVVVLLPRTESTRGAVGATELAATTEGSILVDVSRGGIVDIDAVVDALGTGSLSRAVMDVWEPEPLPAPSPHWDVPGLTVTPHTAGVDSDYFRRLGERIARNVDRLERGEPLVSGVDRTRGY